MSFLLFVQNDKNPMPLDGYFIAAATRAKWHSQEAAAYHPAGALFSPNRGRLDYFPPSQKGD